MKLFLWMVAIALVAGSGWMIYNHNAVNRGFGDVTTRDGSLLQPEHTDAGAADPDGKPVAVPERATRQLDMIAAPQPAEAAPSLAHAGTLASAGALPVADTMAPSAPNGMAFAGTGRFQWYRQGNLTWRLNTDSGTTCIAFATLDEWKKPLVMQHGCGRAA